MNPQEMQAPQSTQPGSKSAAALAFATNLTEGVLKNRQQNEQSSQQEPQNQSADIVNVIVQKLEQVKNELLQAIQSTEVIGEDSENEPIKE